MQPTHHIYITSHTTARIWEGGWSRTTTSVWEGESYRELNLYTSSGKATTLPKLQF